MSSKNYRRKPARLLTYDGERTRESEACRRAGVSFPWYLKSLSDERLVLGQTLSDAERQAVFDRLVESAHRFREYGLMTLHHAKWIRISDDNADYLKTTADGRGIGVAQVLDEIIKTHKKGN